MYPSNLPYLRRREGAYVQTSLSRAFPHDGQTGLSLVARSTLSSKTFPKLSALSFQLSVKPADSRQLTAESRRSLGFGAIGKPGL
jgi:hypothetical protein